jgi:hypothetical protein
MRLDKQIRIEVWFGLSENSFEAHLSKAKTCAVVGVMCRNSQETGDHLIDVVHPTTRGVWITIELSMESQLVCETIDLSLSELDNRH